MFIVFIFLILVYFNDEIVSRDIEVMNSGLMQVRADDMIVVLFVTIRHHGDKARNVMATMVECCEKITEDDIDCDVIQVYGEHLCLQPGATRNVTFLWPNFYGYNRKGSCTVGLWNRGQNPSEESDEIRHKIDFDTMIRPGQVPPHLRGLYMSQKPIQCDTTDLDPFDGCNPVDCRLKYSGLRNFFNHKRKRCQKVPICSGDPAKELPDVVYVPISNTCRNLEKALTEEDIQTLLSGRYDRSERPDLGSKMVNIQCHHGEIDVRTGLCVCDKGWTSEVFDPDAYQVTNIFHMCDKKCHPDLPRRRSYVPIAIGISLALWIMFLVMLCENCNYFSDFFKQEAGEEDEICYCQVEGQQ